MTCYFDFDYIFERLNCLHQLPMIFAFDILVPKKVVRRLSVFAVRTMPSIRGTLELNNYTYSIQHKHLITFITSQHVIPDTEQERRVRQQSLNEN